MQFWYETVKFRRDMFCEKCEQRLARRGSSAPVVDTAGQAIEASAGGGDFDPRADYAITCDCGATMEIRSPEDVEQWKVPDEPGRGRQVVRLT